MAEEKKTTAKKPATKKAATKKAAPKAAEEASRLFIKCGEKSLHFSFWDAKI